MPGVAMRWLIVVGWVGTTSWWFMRDVAPWLGADKLGYRQLLARRASDESTNWRVLVDGRQVGTIISGVQPKTTGAFTVWSQAMLKSALVAAAVGFAGESDVSVHMNAEISPLGRLTSVDVRLSLRGELDKGSEVGALHGEVEGDELVVQPSLNGRPAGQAIRVRFDPSTPIGGDFSPTDKLPGLWVGRKWTTRVVDPQAVLLGGGLLGSAKASREVMHTVTGTVPLEWNGQTWECFVVEDRHADTVGKTWVRRADGVVLRQEANMGRSVMVMELDPRPGMRDEG